MIWPSLSLDVYASFSIFHLTSNCNPGNWHTVDGSEILHPPLEVGSLSHYLQGLLNIQTLVGPTGFLVATLPSSTGCHPFTPIEAVERMEGSTTAIGKWGHQQTPQDGAPCPYYKWMNIPSYTHLQPWLNRVCWGYNYLITRGAPSCMVHGSFVWIHRRNPPNRYQQLPCFKGPVTFSKAHHFGYP